MSRQNSLVILLEVINDARRDVIFCDASEVPACQRAILRACAHLDLAIADMRDAIDRDKS